MQELYGLIKRIAPTPINVLITGESGTGKELIARALHNQSNRAQKPFIIINCGGLPENLVESELFGYRKGAFTGANKAKKGLLETADQGTLFLDEVGELQLSTQVKLLRCVQDGSFIPVGGTEEVSTDVRIIAATNRNIEKDVAEGNFREDLFYRLSGVIIKVPPLRERQDDVLLIAEYLLQRTCKEQNKPLEGFTSEAKAKLRRYNYPGNVRELENIIERAVALETGPFITPASLVIYENIQPVPSSSKSELVLEGKLSIDEYLDQEDCKILEEALERTGGHKGKAAKLVGLNFRQFRYRLSKHAEEISASGNSSPESAGEKQKKSD
jgi:two-component system response regulator PilR (NtrC family)